MRLLLRPRGALASLQLSCLMAFILSLFCLGRIVDIVANEKNMSFLSIGIYAFAFIICILFFSVNIREILLERKKIFDGEKESVKVVSVDAVHPDGSITVIAAPANLILPVTENNKKDVIDASTVATFSEVPTEFEATPAFDGQFEEPTGVVAPRNNS